MQTSTPASQARKPKAPAIPALMPNPVSGKSPTGIFWAVQALNDDACLQALEAMAGPLYGQNTNSSALHTKQIAFTRAVMAAKSEREHSFSRCVSTGSLPFAWRGSRALVEALPSSLRGAA